MPTSRTTADFRETIIRAVTDLNHEAGRMSWWTPTDIKKHLGNARSTTTMRLVTMRAEGIIAYELVFGAGIGGATAGYHYALIGTPPSGGPDIIQGDADLERRAIELARAAAERAEGRKPRHGTNRVARGRVAVSTTADEELWRQAQQDILSQGVAKKFVLDTLIRGYFANKSHQKAARDPFERFSRYFPRAGGPLTRGS